MSRSWRKAFPRIHCVSGFRNRVIKPGYVSVFLGLEFSRQKETKPVLTQLCRCGCETAVREMLGSISRYCRKRPGSLHET